MGWKNFKPKRLVCPHCGYDGASQPGKYEYDIPPFYWFEDLTMVWAVVAVAGKAVERGTIQMSPNSDIPGDSFNPRLFCSQCETEFPVSGGAIADFLCSDEEPDWSNVPATILCPDCRHVAELSAGGDTGYRCRHCDSRAAS